MVLRHHLIYALCSAKDIPDEEGRKNLYTTRREIIDAIFKVNKTHLKLFSIITIFTSLIIFNFITLYIFLILTVRVWNIGNRLFICTLFRLSGRWELHMQWRDGHPYFELYCIFKLTSTKYIAESEGSQQDLHAQGHFLGLQGYFCFHKKLSFFVCCSNFSETT